ncbi:MAG: hypothetical protein LAQ30_04255, partial [Acidobacteriia bacterium]|nr:hypothetical protein [Terriglobia bacterium]
EDAPLVVLFRMGAFLDLEELDVVLLLDFFFAAEAGRLTESAVRAPIHTQPRRAFILWDPV